MLVQQLEYNYFNFTFVCLLFLFTQFCIIFERQPGELNIDIMTGNHFVNVQLVVWKIEWPMTTMTPIVLIATCILNAGMKFFF